MCSGVQPCHSPAHELHLKRTLIKVAAVQICNLKLTAWRGLQSGSKSHHIVVIKIETCDGIARFWNLRLFFKTNGTPVVIELNHTIPFGIMYGISKYSCTFRLVRSF